MLNFSQQILKAIYSKDNGQLAKIKMRQSRKFYSTLRQLVIRNVIKKSGNNSYRLTLKGLVKIQRIKWQQMKKKKGDAWILVIFDIPEKQRKRRDLFRKCLYELGFVKIQRSVFISEYDVYKEVKELAKNCDLKKYVKIFHIRKL